MDAIVSIEQALGVLKHSFGSTLVSQNVTATLQYLEKNPETRKSLKPEDIGIMVRGLQESTHVTIEKKQKRAAKKVSQDFGQGLDDLMSQFNL
jgi:hypothetical protein